MKILDRIFGKIKQKSVAFFSSTLGVSGMENYYDALNLSTFKESLYLFIGVSMIRDTVSSIPLQMHRIVNSDGDTEEVFDDPFLDLMERPNYRQTRLEFMKLAVSYYLLAGETFWYFEREGENGAPSAMVNMRPDYVEIIFNGEKSEVVAYEFRKYDGTSIKIRPEDVLHIKNIDPTNPARGVGVVRPATTRIITEKEASKYQAATFKSQGRPDIAVFTDQDLTEETADDARVKWDKVYNSPNERKSAGFFGASVKDIKLLNVSPKEMDGIESMKFLRDDILAALRIPKQMIDTDVNYNNSKVAYATYIRQACEPVIDTFYDIVNNKWLTDQNAAEDKFLMYETEVGEDRELILKEATETKRAGLITQNEGRQLLGWPSVDGGDEFDDPSGNLFQLAMKRKALRKRAKAVLRKRPILRKKLIAVRAVATMYEAERHYADVKRQRNPVFHSEEMKDAYVRTYNASIDKKSNIFADTVGFYNEGLLKRVLKQIEEFGVNPDRVFDPVVEIPEAKAIFVPLMKAMYAKAGQDTMDSIARGFTGKASEQFVSLDEVVAALERRAEFFILSMLNTDFKQLRDIITQGLSDGVGVEEIGRNLRKYFDDMTTARARTIARTETGRLVSQATDEAYRQSSVVTGKIWLTARDNKVREIEGTVNDHVHNENKTVAPGGVFPNGEQFPGELTINCRCALAPAV